MAVVATQIDPNRGTNEIPVLDDPIPIQTH